MFEALQTSKTTDINRYDYFLVLVKVVFDLYQIMANIEPDTDSGDQIQEQ